MMLVVLTSSPARAIEPLTAYLIASTVAHVVVGGVLWYQGTMKNSSKGASVTPDGSSIGRGATVQWIDTKDIGPNGLPTPKQKDVTVKVDGQKLMNAAKANPSKYPRLADAAEIEKINKNYTQTADLFQDFVPQAGNYMLTSGAYNVSGAWSPSGSPVWVGTAPFSEIWREGSTLYMYVPAGSGLSGSTTMFKSQLYTAPYLGNFDPTLTNSSSPATPSQFAQNLAKSGSPLSSPAGVYSDYFDEIDNYITGNSGSCSVVDTADPSQVATAPSATLPTPATQSQVDSAVAGAASAAASGAALSSASNAVSTAQSNYTANPTPENKQKLDDAIAARDALAAEQAKDAAQLAKDAAEEEEEGDAQDTGGFDSPAYGDKSDSDLNFGTRFKQFFDQMKSTAVFSLPNQFLSGLPTGGTSTMSFNGGRFGQHTFDFSNLSMLWNSLKGLFLVVFGWYSVKIVSLKGGGG